MGSFKEKILYYFELYKKEIIIGGIILIFLLLSTILFYYLYFNKIANKSDDKNVVVEEIKKEDSVNIEKVNIDAVKNEEEVLSDIKKVIVDIKGEVKNPGVYEIEDTKRINDVIKLAGGLTKNASTIVNNLSRKVKDEMVIIIYSKNQIEDFKNTKEEENIIVEEFNKVEDIIINDSIINKEDVDSNTNIENNDNEDVVKDNISDNDNNVNSDIIKDNENSENSKISINQATKEQLMQLDGIGEAKAEAIIKYRDEIGTFKSIEELMNISGIGDKMFNAIKDKITI